MLYSVYGLTLDSESLLPGLPPARDARIADASVHLDCSYPSPRGPRTDESLWYASDFSDPETGQPALVIYRRVLDGSFRCRFPDDAEFIIDASADRIVGRTPPGAALADTVGYLAGPVLGFLLRLRGTVALHASAIEVDGGAIALVGDAGAGKSTTAAMLTRLGCKLITEDIAALSISGDTVLVQPGYPVIGLWPDAVELLYGAADALPRFSDLWDKRRLDLQPSGTFPSGGVPLRAVYVLGERRPLPGPPYIAGAAPAATMLQLVGNIYGNRLLHEELRQVELDLVHRIVNTVPVLTAYASADGRDLARFCAALVDQVA